jgi:hypothetical protein
MANDNSIICACGTLTNVMTAIEPSMRRALGRAVVAGDQTIGGAQDVRTVHRLSRSGICSFGLALVVVGCSLAGCGGVRGTDRPLLQEKPSQVIGADPTAQVAPNAGDSKTSAGSRE